MIRVSPSVMWLSTATDRSDGVGIMMAAFADFGHFDVLGELYLRYNEMEKERGNV